MHRGLLVGGGVLLGGAAAAYVAWRKADAVKEAVLNAVNGADAETKAKIAAARTDEEVKEAVDGARPPAPAEVKAAADRGDTDAVKASSWYTARVNLRLTTYWPWAAKTEKERRMEGGVNDRKGRPLRPLEDFFEGKSDHVSLSGDDAAWPYGQKVTFPWSDGRTVVGRVVDTGSHFRGSEKVYRALGYEPIDVCVRSKDVRAPGKVTAQIIVGDTLDKPERQIAASRFKGQAVEVGQRPIDLIGAKKA